MAVKHEIKSQLAKLLATEDLIVENKKVETACFNVHTRVLTLPMWEKASNNVYDLLVAHEVGHALYTPDEDWIKEHKIPPQFVNVVEDVRIEKLMKRRYAGISKSFFRGYKELSDADFFDIADDDVSTMNLADKANLYFKIGSFVGIPFNDEEREILNLIANTETFADVLEVSKILYDFCKKEHKDAEPPQSPANEGSNSEQSDSSSSDEGQSEEPNPDESYGGTAGADTQDQSELDDGEAEQFGEPEVETMKSLEEGLKNLVNRMTTENEYIELPEINTDKMVISNEKLHSGFSEWDDIPEEIFYPVDSAFQKFKKSAQKEVNYLVKEFECRKSADSYARATTSRTGVLDTSKLHTYRYNEDLFKKVTTLAEGKSHGLMFLLDWSGSMTNVMEDTMKQLFNLMWFCKKVNIPFDVYAFTNDYPWEDNTSYLPRGSYEPKEGVMAIPDWTSLLHLFTHKTKLKDLERQMRNMFRVAWTFTRYVEYRIPIGLHLSGTPLNEALVGFNSIIPKFKQENKLQKVQCVVLTDGEGCSNKFHKTVQRHWESEPYLGMRSFGENCYLRNRKNGRTYHIGHNWWDVTDSFLRLMSDSHPDTNFIGIRVLEPRDANSFIRRYTDFQGFVKLQKVWKKERSFTIHNSGYRSYFAISASSLSSNTDFDVNDGASKTQIKSAFAKSLKGKKVNKRILSEFIELVA